VGIYFALRKGLQMDILYAFAGGFIFAILSRDVLYYSSYILPDALTATLLIFLLISAWKSMENKSDSLGPFLLNGLLAGIMLSLNIRVLMVVVIPILALLFSPNHQRFFTKLIASVAGMMGDFAHFPLCFPGSALLFGKSNCSYLVL
jgi:hypothetical protein